MAPSAEDMLVFAAVARAGGVRRGARDLGLPRSTASRHLASLERAVGARLVSRSTRRFALTDLGRSLLDECARLEDVMRAAERVVASTAREPTGTLSVATSPILGEEFFPDVLAEYLARYPGVRVDVKVAVDFVDLRRAGVDLAVRTGPLQDATDLYATRIGASFKGHYVSPAYAKKRGVPRTPHELAGHACLVVGGESAKTWTFRPQLRVRVGGPLQVDSYRLARSGAVAGLGVARLPDVFAAALVAERALVPVLEKYWEKTTVYAVHASGSPAPVKIRAFIDVLRATMSPKLG